MSVTGNPFQRCSSTQAGCGPCSRCGESQRGTLQISAPGDTSSTWGIQYEFQHTPCSSTTVTDSMGYVYPGETANPTWGPPGEPGFDSCPILIAWAFNCTWQYVYTDSNGNPVYGWVRLPAVKPYHSRVEVYATDALYVTINSTGCIQVDALQPLRDLKATGACANDPGTLRMQADGICKLCQSDSSSAVLAAGDSDGSSGSGGSGTSAGTILTLVAVGAVLVGLLLLLIFIFGGRGSLKGLRGRPTYE